MTRITTQMLTTAAQRNLANSQSALARLQEMGSSGTRLARPSDDPAATAAALRVRSAQRANEIHQRNADDALGWLSTLDNALGTSTDILRRVRALTVQGANDGAMSTESREAIAVELESLRDALLQQANTQYLGRSVFAGNSLAGHAFAPDYSHTGVAGVTLERRIAPDTSVVIDGDGVAAFGSGATSVFALIDDIAADLRAGTPVNSRLDEIDDFASAIVTQRSITGSRYAQVERGKELLEMSSNDLEARRSGLEDADLGKIIIDLKMQEVAYQAALSVTARAIPPTLLEFLA